MLSSKQKRKARQKRLVVQPWIASDRWLQLACIIAELRKEDTDLEALENFKRMPQEMYGEILIRVAPRISKEHTWRRAPIESGIELALALQYLSCELPCNRCAFAAYRVHARFYPFATR